MSSYEGYTSRVSQIVGHPVILEIEKTENSSIYQVMCPKLSHKISRFILRGMPGCHGVCINHAVEVFDPYKNRGIGTILNDMRNEIARDLGYGVMVCTVVSTNIPQIRIMEKNFWQRMFEFNNLRTNNMVCFFKKDLLR